MHLIPDILKLNNLVLAANSTGLIILGGGVAKHLICNANAWVFADVSIIFPLLVAETFEVHANKKTAGKKN